MYASPGGTRKVRFTTPSPSRLGQAHPQTRSRCHSMLLTTPRSTRSRNELASTGLTPSIRRTTLSPTESASSLSSSTSSSSSTVLTLPKTPRTPQNDRISLRGLTLPEVIKNRKFEEVSQKEDISPLFSDNGAELIENGIQMCGATGQFDETGLPMDLPTMTLFQCSPLQNLLSERAKRRLRRALNAEQRQSLKPGDSEVQYRHADPGEMGKKSGKYSESGEPTSVKAKKYRISESTASMDISPCSFTSDNISIRNIATSPSSSVMSFDDLASYIHSPSRQALSRVTQTKRDKNVKCGPLLDSVSEKSIERENLMESVSAELTLAQAELQMLNETIGKLGYINEGSGSQDKKSESSVMGTTEVNKESLHGLNKGYTTAQSVAVIRKIRVDLDEAGLRLRKVCPTALSSDSSGGQVIASMLQTLDELVESIWRASNELAAVRESEVEACSRLDELTQRLASVQARKNELEKRWQELEKFTEERCRALIEAEGERSGLRAGLEARNAEIEALRERLEAHEAEVERSEKSRDMLKNALQSYRDEVETLERLTEKLEDRWRRKLQAREQELNEEKMVYQQERERELSKLEELNTMNAALNDKLDDILQRISQEDEKDPTQTEEQMSDVSMPGAWDSVSASSVGTSDYCRRFEVQGQGGSEIAEALRELYDKLRCSGERMNQLECRLGESSLREAEAERRGALAVESRVQGELEQLRERNFVLEEILRSQEIKCGIRERQYDECLTNLGAEVEAFYVKLYTIHDRLTRRFYQGEHVSQTDDDVNERLDPGNDVGNDVIMADATPHEKSRKRSRVWSRSRIFASSLTSISTYCSALAGSQPPAESTSSTRNASIIDGKVADNQEYVNFVDRDDYFYGLPRKRLRQLFS